MEENIFKYPPKKYLEDIQKIHVTQENSPDSEIENVAKEILNKIQKENYRYENIAILTKNIDSYKTLFNRILRNNNNKETTMPNQTKQDNKESRRDFLKTSSKILLGATALSSLGTHLFSTEIEERNYSLNLSKGEIFWNEQTTIKSSYCNTVTTNTSRM